MPCSFFIFFFRYLQAFFVSIFDIQYSIFELRVSSFELRASSFELRANKIVEDKAAVQCSR